MHVGTPEQLRSALEARLAELSESDIDASTAVVADAELDADFEKIGEDAASDDISEADVEYFDALFDALTEALSDEYDINMSSHDDALLLNVTSDQGLYTLNIPYSDLSFDIGTLDEDVAYIVDYIVDEL